MGTSGCNRTEPYFDHDVIIVGGGPSGTSTAIRLAAFGFNVGIIERQPFPRAHPGICLSDQTRALLDYLSPGPSLLANQYWPRNVTAVKWGSVETNYVKQSGVHLDRGTLDQSLLRKAGSEGVAIYQPASLLQTHLLEKSASGWHICLTSEGRQMELKTRFIVDAAGRNPALPDVRLKDGPRLIALHAPWELHGELEFDGLIESGNEAWLWYAQTDFRRAVLSVFCDPKFLRARRAKNLRSSYEDLLKQFSALTPHKIGRQCALLRAYDASSRHSGNPVSDHHIRVGDACLSVDPLSSQGVHLALLSGIQAAVIVNTILKKPENAALAKSFFQTRLDERVSRYTAMTHNEYGRVAAVRPESFWHERAAGPNALPTIRTMPGPDSPAIPPPLGSIRLAPGVTITKEPVIERDFVEERDVVRHPGMEGAVAFVEGVPLSALLSLLPAEFSFAEIPTYWRDFVPATIMTELSSWLWEKRLLVSVA